MNTEYRYWDSDCFLGWFLSEADKEQHCKAVLDEARIGKITLVTSALTIAEVLVLRGQPRVTSDKRALVERFFKNEFIVVRSLTRRISEKARELVWDHGIYPKDAIHVATAVEAKVATLNTFDAHLIKRSGLIGAQKLVIEKPRVIQTRLIAPMFEDEDYGEE